MRIDEGVSRVAGLFDRRGDSVSGVEPATIMPSKLLATIQDLFTKSQDPLFFSSAIDNELGSNHTHVSPLGL
jgi:hypothetical protein